MHLRRPTSGHTPPGKSVLAAELGAAAAAIAARVENDHAAVSAVDGNGRVLAGWGHRKRSDRARLHNFGSSFAWSEPMAGTPAIGTALATGGIIEIRRFEHWCSGFHPYSCMAVAVRDPATSEAVGSLSVTGFERQLPTAARTHLEEAVIELDTRLRARAAYTSAELVATHRARPPGRFGSVALDTSGRIVAADELARAAMASIAGRGQPLGACRGRAAGFQGGFWILIAGSQAPIDVSRRRVPALRRALGPERN